MFIVVAAIYVGLCFFCLALLALMLALVLLILGPIFSFADGDGWKIFDNSVVDDVVLFLNGQEFHVLLI